MSPQSQWEPILNTSERKWISPVKENLQINSQILGDRKAIETTIQPLFLPPELLDVDFPSDLESRPETSSSLSLEAFDWAHMNLSEFLPLPAQQAPLQKPLPLPDRSGMVRQREQMDVNATTEPLGSSWYLIPLVTVHGLSTHSLPRQTAT